MIRTLKLSALALVMVAGTAGSVFAGQYAWVDDDHTKVREDSYKGAYVIDHADEGEKVYCDYFENGYCYAERQWGEDGFIRKSDLIFKKSKKSNVDVSFCVGNNYGYGFGELCLSN